MRVKRRQRVRVFSVMATFLLLFTMLSPAFVKAESKMHRSLIESQVSANNKLSSRLLDEFTKEEKTTFLVKFVDKADVKQAVKEAEKKASVSNLSGQATQLMTRSAILAELEETSFESHKNVVAFLEEQMEAGSVDDFHSYKIVNGMAVTATKEIAEKIASFPEVDKVLKNETRQLNSTIKTEEKAPTSNIENVEWNVAHIGAPDAWALGFDGTGTVVASLDSGVQWDHPALKEKYRGYDTTTGEVDHQYSFFDATGGRTEAYDDHSHGTHVTGTMVGSEPDGSNQIGVAPGAKWIAVKVFDGGGNTSDSILLEGGEWLLAPGGRADLAPDVVNNSWAGGPGLDEWYLDVVETWRAYGIFPEFSAGNTTPSNGGGPGSIAVPANYPASFATGATDVNDQVADFSLRGPSPYGEVKPDISAPGVNIRSAVPGSRYEGGWNGTSMAGPAVAAVAALLRQVDATISVDEMEEILLNTAKPTTDSEYPESPNDGYGWGIVNAYDAVTSISSDLGILQGRVTKDGEDNEPPTFIHTPITESFVGMDVDLSVRVQDNISVTSVELHYEIDEGESRVIKAPRVSGNYKDGEYRARIPGAEMEGSSLTYKWVIKDFTLNQTESEMYELTIKSGITPGYKENFDEKPIGWRSSGAKDKWEWGVPKSGPGNASSGENVYATNLGGKYEDGMNAMLLMPPVELPEDELLFMEFTHWHHFQESPYGEPWDYGEVVISTDQKNWTALKRVQGASGIWNRDEVDLSDYAGQRVFIGFRAISDVEGTRDGWYIDGVALYDSTQFTDDEEAPVYHHNPQQSKIIGTDFNVTIDVEDNKRIKSVQLAYQNAANEWIAMDADLQSGNYVSGSFNVVIPAEALTEENITYRWTVEDYNGNSVVSEAYQVKVDHHVTVGYLEDFQTAPDGWYSNGVNDQWEWGVPTSGPGSAYLGKNVYATNLKGNQGVNMDAILMMPPLQLPNDDTILFEFTHWYSFHGGYADGSSYHFGHVVISTDNEEWTRLATFSGDSTEWLHDQIDLSAYAGQKVYIGFQATSDDTRLFNRPGWYINQVALYDSTRDQDHEAPTFTHEAQTKAFKEVDLQLEIAVKDNIQVKEVELSYKNSNNEWTTVEVGLQSGNKRDGQYSVIIPGDAITGETFTYRWQLEDHLNNRTESENYVVELEESITVGYVADFESKPIGWHSYSQYDLKDNWEWGVPTSGPKKAVSGEKVFATNLTGKYEDRVWSILEMPPVDLPEGGKTLAFDSWHNFEQSKYGAAWDYGQVVISTDRETWVELKTFIGDSSKWQDVQVDLSAYSGRVYIGFRTITDANGTYDGWYIDDVEIIEGAAVNSKPRLELFNDYKMPEFTNKFSVTTKVKEQNEANEVHAKVGSNLSVKPINDKTASKNDPVQAPTQLPLGATVNVLESGRSVKTSPADGSYTLYQNAGTYTVEASAYGFHSDQQTVTIETAEVSTANFNLTEITTGTVNGVVTDEKTGEGIPNARVILVEDANVQPVQTDDNGHFTLDAYEGSYTMKVMARDYHSVEVDVSIIDGSIDVAIQMTPYYTYPGGEIGYDDGSPENAKVYYEAGNGWGVKMSLPEGKDSAIVTDGVFQFHGADWPSPGGTSIAVEVWDVNADGQPGKKIAGPIKAEAIRDLNEWTVVDLRDEKIVVNGDFFMVYIQQKDNPDAPGLATDQNGKYAQRSYQFVNGSWRQTPANEGNYMIRARIAYEVDIPIITSPQNGFTTNDRNATVEGEASPQSTIQLLNNGEEVGVAETTEDGKFTFATELSEGVNEFTAITLIDGKQTTESQPVIVNLDTEKPTVTILNPKDGDQTNRETAIVEGTVSDANLDTVQVNGQKVAVTADGTWSKRILLDEGANTIQVVAKDHAGNRTKKQITIHAKFSDLQIMNVTPTEDQDLITGESVKITFDSEPGLKASFTIHMPLTSGIQLSNNATELPMMETADGHYVGYWTVPSNLVADGAIIEVKVTDRFGNKATAKAEGLLRINSSQPTK